MRLSRQRVAEAAKQMAGEVLPSDGSVNSALRDRTASGGRLENAVGT
jgi:hypothetical protein